MFFSLNDIVLWLGHYKYLVIFPFAVFEGPIITIIAGFLSSTGVLNFWVSFLVVAAGDLFADNLYYAIGRFGRERFISRFGKYFGLSVARVERIEHQFRTHPWKIYSFGKVAHGTGSIILAAAGMSRVPYWKFIGYNVPTTLANSFVLIVLGYYFGHAYENFNTYFEYAALFVIGALILGYIYFIKKTKNQLE